MVDRIQLEGNFSRSAPSPMRTDFAVKAPPAYSELPEVAITGVSSAYQSATENHQGDDLHAKLGLAWSSLERIHKNEQRQKELDAIRSRLLGHQDKKTPHEGVSGTEEIEADIEAVSALAQGGIGKSEAQPLIIGQKKEASNAAERVSKTDQDRVMARIEQALKNVGKLRSALESDTSTAYDRLVNLNSSISDLNLARSRVDDAEFGLRSASDTVDSVMLHMRAAVAAHGKMSPELVRLVMS